MSLVDALGGGRQSKTRAKPDAASPSQYPTYLGITYLPTYAWPTYSPIAARANETDTKNQAREHNATRHHRSPSTSPTATTVAPTIRTTTKNTHLPSNPTETPTIQVRNHGEIRPSPSISRPSLHGTGTKVVAHTPTLAPKGKGGKSHIQKHNDMRAPTHLSPVSSFNRWSEPSRERTFGRVHTPDPTVTETEMSISYQESTRSPTSAPLSTQEQSNPTTRSTEPDETFKISYTFRVKENPDYLSNGGHKYKIYEHGQDDDEYESAPTKFPSRATYKPTPTLFPTYLPTKTHTGTVEALIPTFLPSYLPTQGNNENLNENLNIRSNEVPLSIYQKRSCPDFPNGIDPSSQMQEQEVIFAYGIQTTDGQLGQSIETSVNMMQYWILEDVARNLLHCSNDESSSGRFLLEPTVSSVYYMENDTSTSLSECTPTYSDATDCAIIQSAMYVTVDVDQADEGRHNAISVIKDSFESGSYVQGTIIHTTFLGPDLDELTLNSDSLKEKTGVSSHPMIFYIAIGVVFLAGCALAACLAMIIRVRKEREKAAASSYAPSHRHSKLAMDDMLHDSYPPPSASFRNSFVFH